MKVLHEHLALPNNCVLENPCSSTCFGIFHPKVFHYTKNKLVHVVRFTNRQKHVVLSWQNNVRTPKLFHLFHLIFMTLSSGKIMRRTTFVPVAFPMPLCRVDSYIKLFPKSVSKIVTTSFSRRTCFCSSLSNEACWNFSNRILTTTPSRITAHVKDDNCC